MSNTNGKDEGVTITVNEHWRDGLTSGAKYIGVPIGEYADFLMQLGMVTMNRTFQRGLNGLMKHWLLEMHSKYPDTFNASAREGSCGHLSIDKLYARWSIPFGKYQEWVAEKPSRQRFR